jgi:prevent-host-death family protein
VLYNLYMSDERIDVTFPKADVDISVSFARAHLPELVERVLNGEAVYLSRYGTRVAALVPADAAEYLDELEDAYWVKKAEEALAEPGPSIPLAQVMAESEALD